MDYIPGFVWFFGKAFFVAELLNRIWGYEYDGETRTLDMHIRTLRQKLGEEGGSCIKTVRGVGYRMIRQEGGKNA